MMTEECWAEFRVNGVENKIPYLVMPSKYTEQNLPTRALKQLIHNKRKRSMTLRVPGNSMCHIALLGHPGKEHGFAVK